MLAFVSVPICICFSNHYFYKPLDYPGVNTSVIYFTKIMFSFHIWEVLILNSDLEVIVTMT